MIKFENISFAYGDRAVLDDFELEVKDGQCVCLSGASGCGKTTALKVAVGLEKPHKGNVLGIERPSVVFQEDRLIPYLSLEKNIMLPLKKGNKVAETKVRELLTEVGLGNVLSKKVRDLSGGMKRRAAIVRAVVFAGDSLILDEPFNGIDGDNKRKVATVIKREFLDKNKPVLMVSHIPSDAELLSADILKMD